MKIAVWYNLSTGGAKRLLHTHVRGLVERGHQLSAWTINEKRDYLPIGELVPERLVPWGWRPRPVGRGPGRLLSRRHDRTLRLRSMVDVCRRCAAEIDAGGFDLVFTVNCEAYAMPLIMRHLRTPSVLYLNEPFRGLYEALPVLPWLGTVDGDAGWWPARAARAARDLWRFLADRAQAREEWRNAQAADTLLVNSYYSRESVLRAYGRDARVCYPGIDTGLFRHLGLERERTVVGVGAVDPGKGIELALRSLALLPAPRPPLVWIADRENAPHREEMDRLAGELGVDFRVRLRVPDAELVELLNRAALMLYTSRLEPFGLAPLEAAACGTPVVAVAEGGVRETIRAGLTGVAVDRDPEALSAAMRRLLDDPAGARRLGETAARHVREEWSTGRSIDRLERELVRTAGTAAEERG